MASVKSLFGRTVTPSTYRQITLGVLLTQALIVLTGAAVRLTGSGLGCSDWPRCEQDRFVPAADYNALIEFINRTISLPVLVAVLLALWGAKRRRPFRPELWSLSLAILIGVVAQILIGAVVVRLELLPHTVMIHFLLSMGLLFGSVILHHRAGLDTPAGASPPVPWEAPRSSVLVGPLTLLAAAVLVTGTVVTGSGPHGGDENAERLGIFLPTATRIHSSTVWLFLALLVVVLVALRADRAPTRLLARGTTILVVALLQGAIGYLQYWNGVPALLVFAHIVGAITVWGTTVWFWLEHRRLTAAAAVTDPPLRSAAT